MYLDGVIAMFVTFGVVLAAGAWFSRTK